MFLRLKIGHYFQQFKDLLYDKSSSFYEPMVHLQVKRTSHFVRFIHLLTSMFEIILLVDNLGRSQTLYLTNQ